ncbi:SDR family NAD(P)-dependent oxidoreductase [Microbacterium sp. zg.B48]|uniref:SDR family NAD(P)-dependent oxidoreductase n=1 Tax=Microbacterium sp. zg.B48 TaxID=2969408 RepID=UPI00214C161A|nr:SDR family NAD(P)-dependent oxidoreductase [Microbacterium sp. zg.B48]MCR2763104.1 SDR family NAD(P)-dependent oxidoreductase [Microbacterium sp. zg.B48]
MSEKESVHGKTIVITGASSGIGRGAAVRLSDLGANVVVAARRGQVLEQLAGEMAERGGIAVPVATDVSAAPDIARLTATAVDRFGRIDVWVNNVGIGALGPFWDVPVEAHARVIDVNVNGLLYGAHAALRRFLAQGSGVLINVGSVESELPLAYQSSYAASKAAVLSLSRTLNEELRLAGVSETIKVGTIMPWAVDTPWWDHAANYTGHAPRMAAMDDPGIVVDAIVAACTDPKEEHPVGGKARVANISHRIFPDLTERLSAKTVDAERQRGFPRLHTQGSIFAPTEAGTAVEGGVRDRMKREDAARARTRS